MPGRASSHPAAKKKTVSTAQSESAAGAAKTTSHAGHAHDTAQHADASQRMSAGRAHETLLRPVISEKSAMLKGMHQYVFEVHPRANKIEVAKAITMMYNVRPARIRIINAPGKTVVRGRVRGRTGSYKKAIVTLPKGTSIPLYEGV